MEKKKRIGLVALLCAIVMLLGVFPIADQKVDAAVTIQNAVFSAVGGNGQSFAPWGNLYKNDVNSYVTGTLKANSVTTTYQVTSNNFVSQWNQNTCNNLGVVVISCHGTYGDLQDELYRTMITAGTISRLNYKQIGCIVLLGCNCGDVTKIKTGNLATAFANRFHCPVIAASGTVYKVNLLGVIKTSKVMVKNENPMWLVYMPSTTASTGGRVYKWNEKTLTVKSLLQGYRNISSDSSKFVGTFRP